MAQYFMLDVAVAAVLAGLVKLNVIGIALAVTIFAISFASTVGTAVWTVTRRR